MVNNCSGVTQCVPEGVCLGEAEVAQVLAAPEPGEDDLETSGTATVKWTTSEPDTWRKAKLLEMLQLPELPPPDSGQDNKITRAKDEDEITYEVSNIFLKGTQRAIPSTLWILGSGHRTSSGTWECTSGSRSTQS